GVEVAARAHTKRYKLIYQRTLVEIHQGIYFKKNKKKSRVIVCLA
ncbi:unnamed protein product, partial [marine sediment metagenome]